jgi:hypothetical protein
MSSLADLITRDRRPAVTISASVEFAGKRRTIVETTVRFEPGEDPAGIRQALDHAFAVARGQIEKEIKLK